MDKLYAEIGDRMRSARNALRLTQAQVAEHVGIDTSYYGQLERGKRIASIKKLILIAGALGVEPGTLLPGRSISPRDAALEGVVNRLDPKGRKLVMGMVSDMVARLNPKKAD